MPLPRKFFILEKDRLLSQKQEEVEGWTSLALAQEMLHVGERSKKRWPLLKHIYAMLVIWPVKLHPILLGHGSEPGTEKYNC